jgi:Ca2+/Na+ antiporter
LLGSFGVLFVLLYNHFSTTYLAQPIYTAIGAIYLLAYVVSLYYVFASGRVQTFKFGWMVLLFFFGFILFPSFWNQHVRERNDAT